MAADTFNATEKQIRFDELMGNRISRLGGARDVADGEIMREGKISRRRVPSNRSAAKRLPADGQTAKRPNAERQSAERKNAEHKSTETEYAGSQTADADRRNRYRSF